jgi:predicted Zn-dependent protease
MKYENREIPEGINVSEEHPLKDFLLLLGGISALIVVVVAGLSLAAGYLVKFIPFSMELALANRTKAEQEIFSNPQISPEEQQIRNYLQNLADALAKAQQLPSDMAITVHYSTDDTLNAFATLGGNIIMYKGLLEKMPSENALAMVMAHEIAHIKHRDPIIAAGRGITVALALGSLAGISDVNISQWLGGVGALTTLSFNREQEASADVEALRTLKSHYGHTKDADVLFTVLKQEDGRHEPPAFLNSHPGLDDRINEIRVFQKQEQKQAQKADKNTEQKITKLPAFIKQAKK